MNTCLGAITLILMAALVQALLAASAGSEPDILPKWHKSGCHLVAHTRTISIPGCVKFNLTTNACRGYCLSYSLPRDIAQPSIKLVQTAPPEVGSQLSGKLMRANEELQGIKVGLVDLKDSNMGREYVSIVRPRVQDPLAPSLPSHLNGAESDQPDVVSMSQCCNMMETEDIIVNVRCEGNQVRRLTFKSALTCECFFCKHISL